MNLEAILILTNGNSKNCNNLIRSLPDNIRKHVLFIIVNDGISPIVIDNITVVKDYLYFDEKEWIFFRNKYSHLLPNIVDQINIGTDFWNTPRARSVSHLICKVLNLSHVLFLDDDYLLKDKKEEFIDEIQLGLKRNNPTIFLSAGSNDYSAFNRFSLLNFDNSADNSDGIGGCFLDSTFSTPFYFPNFYNEDLFWVTSFDKICVVETGMFHVSTKTMTERLAEEEIDIACLLTFWELSENPCLKNINTLRRILKYRVLRLERLIQKISKSKCDSRYISYITNCILVIKSVDIDRLYEKILNELKFQINWNTFYAL